MRSLLVLTAVALVLAVALVRADHKAPQVNVYTRTPVEFGVENELICHCSGFHPPRISMKLKHGGQEFENCVDSDLSFEKDWTYHKMIHIKFVPEKGTEYVCEVVHDEGTPQTFKLEII